MTINKFLTIRFCLLSVASALCLSACSQLDPTSDEKVGGGKGQNTELVYTADMDALVDDSPIEPVSPNEARGLYDATSNTETHEGLPFTLKDKEYAAGSDRHTHIVPILDFDRSKKAADPHKGEERKHILKSVLALYDKTKNKSYLANAEWSVYFVEVPTPEGQPKKPDITKLTLRKLAIQFEATATAEDKKLDPQHEWYMMGFLGGVKIVDNKVQVRLNSVDIEDGKDYYPDMYLRAVSPEKKVSIPVPFASGWRQILVDTARMHISPKLGQNQTKRTDHLTFKPQAAFIELGVENYMSFAVSLSSELTMESNCLTTEGNYDFSALNPSDFSVLIPTMEAKTYWKPSGTKKDRVNDAWVEHNGVHYVNTFKFLNRITSLAARQGNSPSKHSGRYIIAVMPFDPQKAPLERSQTFDLHLALPQTLFFGEPKDVGRIPSNLTSKPASYQSNPEYLTPVFGKRYLLGSTGETFYKQKSYAMMLRIIRPMLPIEHIYLHNSQNPSRKDKVNRATAEAMGPERMNQAYKDKYRLPYWSEIGPILTLNYKTLTEGEVARGQLEPPDGKVVDWGREYRRVGSVVASPQVVTIQDKVFDMVHFYNWSDGDRADNDKRIYGLTYLDPNFRRMNYVKKEGGYVRPADETNPDGSKKQSWNRTNMYKCATRIIYSRDGEMVRIATYYLGPNLDINNQFYYTMHDSFWKTVDQSAIIERELPFNGMNEEFIWYWGDGNTKTHPEYKNRKRMTIKRSGQTGTGDDKTDGEAWTVYWLKKNSW